MVGSMSAHLHLAHPARAEGQSERAVPITVVLADCHAVVRRSLRRLLDGAENVNVVAEASDLSTAVRAVESDLPRVLVLDLGLPNRSCIETISQLRELVPRTEV